MISNGEILALLVAKGFEGDVGPMGGEDPEIDGNLLRLTSQSPDSVYRFNDDGSVDEVWEGDREEVLSGLMDAGFDQEDAEALYEDGPHHYDSVMDLLDDGGDRTTWFMYFEEEHPQLYNIIKQFVSLIKIEDDPYENPKD